MVLKLLLKFQICLICLHILSLSCAYNYNNAAAVSGSAQKIFFSSNFFSCHDISIMLTSDKPLVYLDFNAKKELLMLAVLLDQEDCTQDLTRCSNTLIQGGNLIFLDDIENIIEVLSGMIKNNTDRYDEHVHNCVDALQQLLQELETISITITQEDRSSLRDVFICSNVAIEDTECMGYSVKSMQKKPTESRQDTFSQVTVKNHLQVKGNSSLGNTTINKGKTLTVAGTLGVMGNTSLNTLKTSGRATLNSLTVSGATTLDGPINLKSPLDITSTFTYGNWHNIGGNKSINSISTSGTHILTLTFASLAGSTNPLYKGAKVKIKLFVSGSIDGTNSENYYESDLLVAPGATRGSASKLIPINESSTNIEGTATILTSGISGTGTTAFINLTSSATMTGQSVAIFYAVDSDNLTSVA